MFHLEPFPGESGNDKGHAGDQTVPGPSQASPTSHGQASGGAVRRKRRAIPVEQPSAGPSATRSRRDEAEIDRQSNCGSASEGASASAGPAGRHGLTP